MRSEEFVGILANRSDYLPALYDGAFLYLDLVQVSVE